MNLTFLHRGGGWDDAHGAKFKRLITEEREDDGREGKRLKEGVDLLLWWRDQHFCL